MIVSCFIYSEIIRVGEVLTEWKRTVALFQSHQSNLGSIINIILSTEARDVIWEDYNDDDCGSTTNDNTCHDGLDDHTLGQTVLTKAGRVPQLRYFR